MTQKLNTSNSDFMPKKELEQIFTSIQERFNAVDNRFDEQDKLIQQRFDKQDKHIQQRFDSMDRKLQMILDIVRVYDIERKEFKGTFWEHDRRLKKIEQQLV